MSREIRLTICGTQTPGGGQDEKVEVVSVGQMYEKDGFTCLEYDEVIDEEDNGMVQVAKNLIRINDKQVEVIKNGPAESHMVFVPDQTTYTYYTTPVGELEVSIHTENVQKITKENGFSLNLQYDLEMNQTFISRCSVDIAVEQ